jgi:signal transduction histidine kinase
VRKRPLTDQSGAGQGQAADQDPAPAAIEAQETPKADEQRAAGRKKSRFALRNWRVSWRLIALIAIPTVTAMYFGGLRIDEAVHSAGSFQQVERLANLGDAVTHLANAMEDENNALAAYIAEGRPKGTMPPEVTQHFAVTNAAARQVTSLASGVGSAYPAQVQDDLSAVLDRISDLSHYRAAALGTKAPALTVIKNYSLAIADLFTLNDQIAEGTSDTTLANNVRALGALERDEDQATQQRAILYSALIANDKFEPGAAQALSNAVASQAALLAEFQSAASIGEAQYYQDTVAGAAVDDAGQMEQQAVATSGNGTNVSVSLPAAPAKFANTAVAWNTDMSANVASIRKVEQGLVDQVISRSQSLHAAATRTAVETGILVLAVLIIVLLITIVVARSMVRPLRKLRTGALEVAGLRLPETVRRMSETDGEGVSFEVEPIDVDSSDEIGEVARAFDQVHREALRLAANEAALRGNVNAMFVNLSRRSQSLVERQIRLIDDLEQGEQDPERLASLFQMDHLATRMRRNSENLLVLAGHDESRRWNQPVALVDVLRAALSEIEQYERVTLNVQPGISVRGQAVSDVVHLTAELIENATSFSAADTPVTIAGHLLSSGGVLLEITDQGVGMGAEEMAHANWRLDNPPVVDVAVSRRMGLFVVARLAARHGIRVRLRPAASGGLIALVWLPDEAIMHDAPDGTPGLRRDDSTSPDAVLAPVTDGVFGSNGGTASIWADSERGAAAKEVDAARAPKFASLRADEEESSLGPKRVPGMGPRPGQGWATTGPLPAFRTVPRPASNGGPEPAATGPLPAATGPLPAVTGPLPAVTGPQPAVTGPQPVIDTGAPVIDAGADQAGSSPSSFDSFVKGLQAREENGTADEPADTGAQPALGAPAASWETGGSPSGVVVPPANGGGEEHRLPIFEAVESDWFRRGRQAVGRPSAPPAESEPGNGWASAGDAGWRAAEVVSAPSSAGVTPAGLPKRVPQANLVPGAATAAGAAPAVPARSAAATRDRFASFQRGAKEGRAAASETGSSDGEDESSG